MDLDFLDCFERKKTLSFNQRNVVPVFHLKLKPHAVPGGVKSPPIIPVVCSSVCSHPLQLAPSVLSENHVFLLNQVLLLIPEITVPFI